MEVREREICCWPSSGVGLRLPLERGVYKRGLIIASVIHTILFLHRQKEDDLPQASTLRVIIEKLDGAIRAKDVQKLQFTLLNGLLKVSNQL